MNNVSILNGSNDCLSIRPLIPLDARNCLCGRPAAGSVTIDGSSVAYDYSSIRGNWGCDGPDSRHRQTHAERSSDRPNPRMAMRPKR